METAMIFEEFCSIIISFKSVNCDRILTVKNIVVFKTDFHCYICKQKFFTDVLSEGEI